MQHILVTPRNFILPNTTIARQSGDQVVHSLQELFSLPKKFKYNAWTVKVLQNGQAFEIKECIMHKTMF